MNKNYEKRAAIAMIIFAAMVVFMGLLIAAHDADAQQIVPAMWASAPCDSVSYNPAFAPPPWPEWGEPCFGYHPSGDRINRRATWMDTDGRLKWGVLVRSPRVISPYEPDQTNRAYDPCNYIEHLGEPGYPGVCLRTVKARYR